MFSRNQCEWGRPVPQSSQDLGWPVHAGAGSAPLPLLEAKTERFFLRRVEPQRGHFVPRQFDDRTRTSLVVSHCSQ